MRNEGMAKMAEELLITDMTCSQPATAWFDTESNVFCPISKELRNSWRVIDYRTESFSGRLLMAINPRVPILTIPLNLKGWHAVSIGLAGRYGFLGRIEVRLIGQRQWQEFRSDPSVAKVRWKSWKLGYKPTLNEEPWIFADLTGHDLQLRSPQDLQDMQFATIWSVRAVPVKDRDLKIVQSNRHRTMVYLYDGGTPHRVAARLRAFADSNWDICCYGVGGADVVHYPTKTGTREYQDGWLFARKGDAKMARILKSMSNRRQDPLCQAINLAHRQRHRIWAYIRPQGWVFDPPHDHMWRSRFFCAHPEYRCVGADGVSLSKLSIAYNEVRQQMNGILKETVARGADGVCIAFVRGYPLVRYEQPVLARYKELYGTDARQVSDTDERLRSVWKEFVTTWLHEIRGILDTAGSAVATGKRRELAVIAGANPAEWDACWGIDVAAWARKGLLDAVLLYPMGLEHPTSPVDTDKIRVDLYVQALRDTGVKVIPSLGNWADHKTSVVDYYRRALVFYRAGADGLTRWDTEAWMVNLDLDDPEILDLWCERYMPPQDNVIREFAGLVVDRFTPMIAG